MKVMAPRLEVLEPRIAPASTLNFIDVDGDAVKITSSLGDLAGHGTFATIGAGEQLQTLDLTDASFQGTAITTVVTKKPGGDGLVNIGYLNATGRDLKSVTVKGDLGRIDAGDADLATPGIGKFTARSMGMLGTATQAPAAPDLQSDVFGPISTFTLQKDFREAILTVRGIADTNTIGTINIGGSMIGGDAVNSGSIFTFFGDIGVAKIRGDIRGGIGGSSGVLSADHIAQATVSGSIVGGDGMLSGRIRSNLGLGKIKIGHDVVGGDGEESGSILSRGDFTSVEIGGSVLGGPGVKSGRVWTFNAGDDIGSVKVKGNVVGGDGNESGTIIARGELKALTVGGSVIGGAGSYTVALDFAQVYGATGIGTVKIGRSLIGGGGEAGAQIHSGGALGALTIGGSVIGGAGASTGVIDVNGFAGALKIGGSILGGLGNGSGALDISAGAKSITARGSVIGFDGADSGRITTGEVEAISIGGDLRGGDGTLTGSITVTQGAGKISIGGSVMASFGSALLISITDRVGSLAIKGNVEGLQGAPAQIFAGEPATVPAFEEEALAFGKITIGGDVHRALIVALNGSGRIGPVKVGGDWSASSLAAGVTSGPTGFGTAADVPGSTNPAIASRIASIAIKGVVAGSSTPGDHFGFVAREIGILSALGVNVAPGPTTSLELSPVTGDVTLRTF